MWVRDDYTDNLNQRNEDYTVISIEEIKYIRKIVRPLKESVLLIKNVSETIENEAKEQKGGFLSVILSILVSSFQEIYWQIN